MKVAMRSPSQAAFRAARWAATVLALTVMLLGAACDDGEDAPDAGSTAGIATAAAVPSPVVIAGEPKEGFTLGDPSLEALPGATVDFGRLGGMNYQIEKPDDWNGRLVMYAHGNDDALEVYPPPNRKYLIENGYAWGSSSYSVNVSIVTGVAADETAAVWDHFVATHGRPQYSYIMGDSMGGSVAFQSAERYADRYSGSLPLCGDANSYDIQGDFFTAAAYIAGVTEAEWEASGENVGSIIDTRLRPMLRDPAERTRFIALWSDISGGERPFVDEGVAVYQEQIWVYVLGNLFQGVFDNSAREYALGDAAGVSSENYNAGVLRITGEPGADEYAEVNTITGDIKIPTLMVQPTGDALTIFQQAQELRRRAEDKGRGELLVERAIQSPLHCFDRGLTAQELRESFEDLVGWVELGEKPEGEDLSGDVTSAGKDFTRKPRVGSDAAADLPGADDRLTVSGTITVEGQPRGDGFIWVDVITDGRRQSCSYNNATFDAGTYTTMVATSAEAAECGADGRMIQVLFFEDGTRYAAAPVPWPSGETSLTVDLAFTQADLAPDESFGTSISGLLVDADGIALPVGTTVEAYVGDVLCASYTVPSVVLVFDNGDTYGMAVPPEAVIPGCAEGAEVTFRMDGEVVEGTVSHDLAIYEIDIRLP